MRVIYPAGIAGAAYAGAANPGIVMLPVDQRKVAGCSVEGHYPTVLIILRTNDHYRFFAIPAPLRTEYGYLAVGIAFGIFLKLFRVVFYVCRDVLYSRNISNHHFINSIFLCIEDESFR